MIYHILNGDSLASTFPEAKIEGEIIVAREALIDGDIHGDNLPEFWHTRAKYMQVPYNEFYEKVVTEFERILNAPDNSQFNLWFGYDLFCQVNMWFVLSLIHDLPIKNQTYVVYPTFLGQSDIWKEFGNATAENLNTSINNRVRFNKTDFELGKNLWKAYKKNDLEKLVELSYFKSACFPHLHEACKAHIDRFPTEGKIGRPEKVIKDIIHKGSSDFYTVFKEFFEREGVYGFGDIQFKRLYEKVMKYG